MSQRIELRHQNANPLSRSEGIKTAAPPASLSSAMAKQACSKKNLTLGPRFSFRAVYKLKVRSLFDRETDRETAEKRSRPRQKSPHGHHNEMENTSVSEVVLERLASLGLAQIPPGALAILAQKLEGHLRRIASKTITPRATARAVLASAQPSAAATESTTGGRATEPTPNP